MGSSGRRESVIKQASSFCCVFLGMFLQLSEPQFFLSVKWAQCSSLHQKQVLNEVEQIKRLEICQMQSVSN